MVNLSYLKDSPMFQLSLTSKELFHSNFIYWIISNYKAAFSKIFSNLMSSNSLVITNIKREEKYKDIVIYFKDTTGKELKLILENKVKSIPKYEQLRKYTTQDLSESYILLSLAKPTFLENGNKITIQEFDREWIYIDYNDLASMLEEILPEIYSNNSYHYLIVTDYIKLIRELNNLKKQIYENVENGVYDLYQKQNTWINSLKEIRLHDFYIKLYHHIIASEIYQRIKEELPNVRLVSNEDWKKSVPQEIFTGSGYTNSGLSEVKYVIGEKFGSPVIVGIQIEGKQFRLFIQSKKSVAIKIAEELFNNHLWFDFSTIVSSGISATKEYPIRKNKKFNSYTDEFFYRYVNLNNCKIKDLIDIVIEYIHIIHRQKEYFLRTIQEIDFQDDVTHK